MSGEDDWGGGERLVCGEGRRGGGDAMKACVEGGETAGAGENSQGEQSGERWAASGWLVGGRWAAGVEGEAIGKYRSPFSLLLLTFLFPLLFLPLFSLALLPLAPVSLTLLSYAHSYPPSRESFPPSSNVASFSILSTSI